MAIITASDWKSYKGISATTYDAQLAVIIPAAQSAVEKWCDRIFDTATYTEKINGNDWHRIVLRNVPVTTLTSVSVVGPDGSSSTIGSTSYTFEAESGVIGFQPANEGVLVVDDWGAINTNAQWISTPRFSNGFQNISVVYVGGYSSGTMPAGLKLAMYQYVDVLMAQATAGVGAGAFKSERLGDYNYERMTSEESESLMVRLFGPWRRLTS